MREHGTGMIDAHFTPTLRLAGIVGAPMLDTVPSIWINRCALRAGRDARVALMVMQGEQSLALDTLHRAAMYTVSIQEPKEGETLTDPGNGAWLSKGRIVRLEQGDKVMAFATGAGAPDPGVNAPWSVEDYIGFDRQVYHTYRMLNRDIKRWETGDRLVQLQRDVKGQPTDEQVLCEDAQSFWLLQWTPWEAVLEERPAIYYSSRMGLA